MEEKYKIINIFNKYTIESCYWAGFIAADGNIQINTINGTYRISIQLSSKDKLHLEKFKNIIKCRNTISFSKNNNICYIQIGSKQLVNSLLENYNIIPNKSLILQPVPSKFPNNMLKHYIRGYFDGDGSIGYNGRYCNFNITTGSEDFVNWVSNTLQYFGLISKQYVYKKKKYFCIDVNNKDSIKIFDWMYEESEENNRLNRKYEKYFNCKKNIKELLEKNKINGIHSFPGCKGYNLDYKKISEEYLNNKTLKELSEKYNVSKWTLLDNFKKLNIRKIKKINKDKNSFNKYTKESCYWAGFIAADGYVNKYRLTIMLSEKDTSHLEKIKFFLKTDCKIKRTFVLKNNKKYYFSSISISSKNIVKDLKENFNIVSAKSLILLPPYNIPKNLISHFIRGYIDGDGSYGWHKYDKKIRISVCSGSFVFLDWLKNNILNIVKSYKINSKISKNKKTNLYSIEFKANYVNEILNWLYFESEENIRLDRKYNIIGDKNK